MITGVVTPTSGTVTVDGHDIQKDTKEARKSISLCPQYDVLYPELTVYEHLKMYAKIKGVSNDEIDREVNEVIDQVHLLMAKDRVAEALSGGMKRKLSLGIAMVGGTQTLILDEPTSGMDPDARRAVWDLLLSLRRKKTILLTTHYMEEADAVADKIAIMSAGEVKCFGSAIFLKRLFGSGYQLRIAKGMGFDFDRLDQIIRRHFPRSLLLSEVETEVMYSLENISPDGGHDNSHFPAFFKDVDVSDIGIASCGLSMTTMEEVFLKVGRLDEGKEKTDIPDDTSSECSSVQSSSTRTIPKVDSELHMTETDRSFREDQRSFSRSVGCLLDSAKDYCHTSAIQIFVQRIRGLFIKRLHFSKRYWPNIVFQLVVPCLVFSLLLGLDGYMKKLDHDDPHELDIDMSAIYGPTNGWFEGDNDKNDSDSFVFGNDYYKKFAEDTSVNITLLPTHVPPADYLVNCSKTMTIQQYSSNYLAGASVISNNYSDHRSYKIWYNNEALHSAPAAVNIFYRSVQQELFNDLYSVGGYNTSMEVSNHPFPSEQQYLAILAMTESLNYLWMAIVPMTLPFMAASYVLFPSNESNSKSKLLQLMCGVHPVAYWTINFLFDLVSHFFCSFVIYGVFMWLDFNHVFVNYSESRCEFFGSLCRCLIIF